MKDNFNLPWKKNEGSADLSNLNKLWDIAFEKLISEEGRIINQELLHGSKLTEKSKKFRVNKFIRLSIDRYLSDIKNQN